MSRILIPLILSVILIIGNVNALKYEDKPKITAYISGTNHLTRGDYKTIYLTVYNSAERKKVCYFEKEEAMFFKDETMLFTAYNVELELVGNENIIVKTPPQKIPALVPFKPVTIPFVVEVKDNASGTYDLKLKVRFDRIDDLVTLEVFYPPTDPRGWMPVEKRVQTIDQVQSGTTTSGNNTTTSSVTTSGGEQVEVYEYKPLTEYYKLRYKSESYEIPITVYVEERGVKIEITNVTANLVGKGKGVLKLTVKNVGDQKAKNSYLVVDLPSGFTSASSTKSDNIGGQMAMMPMQMGMPIQTPLQTTMPTGMSTTSKSLASHHIGDLNVNETKEAVFYIKCDVKDEGNYTFKAKLIYTDEYGNVRESNQIPFGVHVSKAPTFDVRTLKSEVFVNSKGVLILEVKPTRDLSDVTAYIRANPPLSTLSSEYYLGDVKADGVYKAYFKLQASDESKPITYPVEVRFKYKSLDEYFETDPIKIGVKVNPKLKIDVSGEPTLTAGGEGVVEWRIKNIGNFTIRDAVARITIIDPFSSSDDTAYIGTLKPGDSAIVKFKLKVDRDATPKRYGLNLEVKYKDLEDEWAISDPVKAVVVVKQAKMPYKTIAVILAFVVVLGIGLAIYRRRRNA